MLFILGLILYGLGRATQQASIFMPRAGQKPNPFLDESREIHLAGWLEPIGLIMASLPIGMQMYKHSYWYILMFVLGYFIYWLPYALLYCELRDKLWFTYGQQYNIGIGKLWVKVRLLSKSESVIMFIVSCVLSFYLLR